MILCREVTKRSEALKQSLAVRGGSWAWLEHRKEKQGGDFVALCGDFRRSALRDVAAAV